MANERFGRPKPSVVSQRIVGCELLSRDRSYDALLVLLLVATTAATPSDTRNSKAEAESAATYICMYCSIYLGEAMKLNRDRKDTIARFAILVFYFVAIQLMWRDP